MRGLAVFGAAALIAGSTLITGTALAQTSEDMAELSAEDVDLDTAADLVEVCAAGQGDSESLQALALCYGFIEGVYVMHEALAATEDGVRLICPPDGASRKTASQVFVTWAGKNPDAMSGPALDGLFQAWVEVYPCPE